LTRDQVPEALLATARVEFLRYGFDGTDVNRIARRSGSSPNTFYRLFKDKTDVFLAIFRRWSEEERQGLQRLLARRGPMPPIVEACIARYRSHAPFRRSLRLLGSEDARVRRAIAEARLETVTTLKSGLADPRADDAEIAFDLLRFEQLAATLAEGELAEMGFGDGAARAELAAILTRWRTSHGPALPIPVLVSEALLA